MTGLQWTPAVFEIGNSLREARMRKGLDFPELETGDEDPREVPARARGRGVRDAARRRPTSRASCARTRTTSASTASCTWTSTTSATAPATRCSSGGSGAPRRRAGRTRQRAGGGSSRSWSGSRSSGSRVVTALVIAAWRFGGSGHQSLPLDTPADTGAARAPAGLLVRAVGGNTLLIVRSGSESGRQVWNGTLTNGEHAALRHRQAPLGLHRFARERAHAAERARRARRRLRSRAA